MAFAEDLSLFYDTVTGHAVAAVITFADNTTRNVSIIPNFPSEEVIMYDTSIESKKPDFRIQTSEISGAKRGDSILINSVSYEIARIHYIDDGKEAIVSLKT